MVGELINGQKIARVGLNRLGERMEIHRPDGTATENKYNKISDTDKTFSKVAEETGRLTYESMDERPSEAGVMGGRVDTETPLIMLRDDTVAQEDDHIKPLSTGGEFILDQRVPRDIFVLFKATLVQNG